LRTAPCSLASRVGSSLINYKLVCHSERSELPPLLAQSELAATRRLLRPFGLGFVAGVAIHARCRPPAARNLPICRARFSDHLNMTILIYKESTRSDFLLAATLGKRLIASRRSFASLRMTCTKYVKESLTIGLPSTHANWESFFQLRTLTQLRVCHGRAFSAR
jgi:hypothetical protein